MKNGKTRAQCQKEVYPEGNGGGKKPMPAKKKSGGKKPSRSSRY